MGKPLRCVETFVNVKEKTHNSYIDRNKRQIFEFDNGILRSIYLYDKNNENMKKREYMYIHLQRRFMKNLVVDSNKFLIISNKFIDYRKIDSKFILRNTKVCILYKRYLKMRRSWNKRKIMIKNLLR